MKRFFFTALIILIIFGSLLSCGPQSRKISRFTGKPVKIKLPKDCYKVISVSVTNDTKNNNQIKNVTYIDTKGNLLTREFTDWGILEGSIKWVRHDGSPYMNPGN